MSKTLIIDQAPGEVRAGLFDAHDQALALYVERAFETHTRASAGALYCGRVKTVDASLNAAFVDLGLGAPGFMPLGKERGKSGVFEGAAIVVRVRREAFAEKGPLLMHEDKGRDCAALACPSLLKPAPDFIQRINIRDTEQREASRTDRDMLDAAFDAALDPLVRLPGGGEVMIEPTRAMVAVDIDTASDKSRALDVNVEAIDVIFRHLALRGLAGIIAIDFAPMKGAKERKKLETALTQAVNRQHGRMECAPLTRFGVAVLTLQRSHRPIAETMLHANGTPRTATIALDALRAVHNEHRANPAKAIRLSAPATVIRWLEKNRAFWTAPLLTGLGARLTFCENANLNEDQFEVIAQ